MKTLIIYCHHYEKSLNAGILETLKKSYDKYGRDYKVLNLVEDKFNPDYTLEELHLFHNGETSDPLVTKYQKMLMWAEQVIMIYPIWWSDMPALLKGFFDKVMKVNFAYVYDNTGALVGTLNHIKRVVSITTMATPHAIYRAYCADAVQKLHLDTIWNQLGVPNNLWINFDGTVLENPNIIKNRLEELEDKIKNNDL